MVPSKIGTDAANREIFLNVVKSPLIIMFEDSMSLADEGPRASGVKLYFCVQECWDDGMNGFGLVVPLMLTQLACKSLTDTSFSSVSVKATIKAKKKT